MDIERERERERENKSSLFIQSGIPNVFVQFKLSLNLLVLTINHKPTNRLNILLSSCLVLDVVYVSVCVCVIVELIKTH